MSVSRAVLTTHQRTDFLDSCRLTAAPAGMKKQSELTTVGMNEKNRKMSMPPLLSTTVPGRHSDAVGADIAQYDKHWQPLLRFTAVLGRTWA